MQCIHYGVFIYLFLFTPIFFLQETILCFSWKSCPRCGLMNLLLWYWQLTRWWFCALENQWLSCFLTFYIFVQVLESVIKYRWNALPVEQRDGMKNYISEVIVQVFTSLKHMLREWLRFIIFFHILSFLLPDIDNFTIFFS